jgi:hypothetical protein
MVPATCVVPSAIRGILPENSWVAAPCCSIAADGGDFGNLADGRTDHLDRADRLLGFRHVADQLREAAILARVAAKER